MILQVSSDAIFHNEYPILIPENALPHNVEQSITPRIVKISFFREDLDFFPGIFHVFTSAVCFPAFRPRVSLFFVSTLILPYLGPNKNKNLLLLSVFQNFRRVHPIQLRHHKQIDCFIGCQDSGKNQNIQIPWELQMNGARHVSDKGGENRIHKPF